MKKALDIHFARTPLHGSDELVLLAFSGTYWDDIYYFPKQYQIGLIHKGAGTFTIGEVAWNLVEGDVYFIAPNLVHKGKPDSETGWTVTVLDIEPTALEAFMRESGMNAGVVERIFTEFRPRPEYADAVRQLFSEFDTSTSLEEALQLVFAFICTCAESYGTHSLQKEPHTSVVKARHYIETHYTEKISLNDLAEEAHLSKYHLLRLFKQETGLAPLTYQLHLRLNAARNLMFLQKSLTDIAYTLGFTDQSHFIHTYKKYATITPKELQKTAIFNNFDDAP
jgi:AraC-like DNA-binding protein